MQNDLVATGILGRIKPRTLKMMIFWLLACFFILAGTVSSQAQIPTQMEMVAANQKLALYVNPKSGEFAVYDQISGSVWWSNPPEREMDKRAVGVNKMELNAQLILRYCHTERNSELKINSHVASANRGGVQVKKVKDGFRVEYGFPREGFVVPLEVTLQGDFLQVTLLVEEIEEPETLLLTSLDLLPYFAASSLQDEGYLFVPDGSGALINFNNGKDKSDPFRGTVYGTDPTFQPERSPLTREDVKIPVFGIKNQNLALLAVIKDGAALGTINASVSGQNNSYNNAYFEFKLRSSTTFRELNQIFLLYEKGKITADNITVRYYLWSEQKTDYLGMAEKYRDYLTTEHQMVAKPSDGVPLYLDLYGAVRVRKSVFGLPRQVNEALSTFDEIKTLTSTMKKMGINDLVLSLRDWTPEKLEKKIPIRVTPLGRLGGRKSFNELTAHLQRNGVEFYPEFNFIEFNQSANGFSLLKDSAIHLTQLPILQFGYKRSSYLKDLNMGKREWRLLIPEKASLAVEKFNKNYQEKNISGLMLSGMPNKVYSDFSDNPSGRENTLKIWKENLNRLSATTGGLLANNPNAYAFPYLDHVVALPTEGSGFEILDRTVPFIQIVLHGLVPYAASPLNLASNPQDFFLKAVETGSFLNYAWVTGDSSLLKETALNHVYSSNYDVWLDEAILQYKRTKELYGLIKNEVIINHLEVAEGVFATEYANGYMVVVNYNDQPVTVYDRVLAAKNFLFFKKGDN